MPFQISITHEAELQLRSLPVREQRIVEAAVTTRLRNQPTIPTKAIKRLRINPLAEFELRVGDLRVLYNVEVVNAELILLILGRKKGNSLIVKGEVFHGPQSHSPEPAKDGSPRGAE